MDRRRALCAESQLNENTLHLLFFSLDRQKAASAARLVGFFKKKNYLFTKVCAKFL
jgi:hypothetical protein